MRAAAAPAERPWWKQWEKWRERYSSEGYRGKVPDSTTEAACAALHCRTLADMSEEERARMVALYGPLSPRAVTKIAVRERSMARMRRWKPRRGKVRS